MLHNYLVRSFVFYSVYHKNPVNKRIHQITIPLIVWTIMLLLGYVPIYSFESPFDVLSINASFVPLIFYVIMYFIFDIPSALILTPILYGMYVGANAFRDNVPYAWAYGVSLHIVSWILQFMGHGIWEKNRPALLDSLIQAFLMAPIFVLLELVFECGFRKELQEELTQIQPIITA